MCNAWNHAHSCTCGWGGEGHLGRNYDRHEYSNRYKLTDSFCVRSPCPHCGQYVYFVRHNGGSVWFDELGKPWPKHSCFYITSSPTRAQKDINDGISNWLAKLTDPLIGIVIEVPTDESKYISVYCSDDAVHKMRVLVKFSVNGFLNEFVIISSAERKLVRPYLRMETVLDIDNEEVIKKVIASISDHQPADYKPEIVPTIRPQQDRKCEYCSTPLSEIKDIGAHLRDHPDWKCPHCSFVTLSYDSYRHHVKTSHPKNS